MGTPGGYGPHSFTKSAIRDAFARLVCNTFVSKEETDEILHRIRLQFLLLNTILPSLKGLLLNPSKHLFIVDRNDVFHNCQQLKYCQSCASEGKNILG